MEEEKLKLETLLKNNYENNSIFKILSLEISPGTNKGDNYMSEIKRAKMLVMLKCGKKIKKSVIIKGLPPTEFHRKMLKDMALFNREIVMYRDIIPKINDVLMEFEDYCDPIWADMLDYDISGQIIFSDLAEKGYKMASRKEGLDLNHCLIVMRTLAKFHATSVIAYERGYIPMELFQNHVFSLEKMKNIIEDFDTSSMEKLISIMETEWEPEWQPTAEKLKEFILPKFADIMKNDRIFKENEFNVLNHGDCWVNNMLFKYGIDSVTPISVNFVDMQLSFYNSPAFDLQYFLSTSLNLDARKSLNEIIRVYHESLVKQLKLHNYSGPIITFEELQNELSNKNLFGISIGVCLMPYVYREETDGNFLEIEEVLKDITKENSKMDKSKFPECKHPMFHIVLKELLNQLKNNNNYWPTK